MEQSREQYITRKLFQNTMLTMLVAEISNAVAAVIDGVVTGAFLGPTALAAYGIGGPYFSIASILSGILMVGSTMMCTRAAGKGDTEETTRVFSLTMVLGVVLSVLFCLSGVLFPGAYATMFGARGASASLHSVTTDYLRGVFIGAPGFILMIILTPILQLDGDSLRPKLACLCSAAFDIIGDLLVALVFHGGMFGIGLASSISHYLGLLIVLTHFFKKKSNMFRFSLRGVRPAMAPAIMRDGLPRAVCMLCRALLPIYLNGLALKLAGDMGAAAYSAMISTTFAVASLGWGIGGAVFIMCGMSFSEQDTKAILIETGTAGKDILFGVIPLAAVVFLASPLIARLFIPDAGEAYPMAITAIRCYALSLPFLAFNVSSANFFQAIEHKTASYIINICIEFACIALMALLLTGRFGINGMFYAFPAGAALLSVVIALCAVFRRDQSREGAAAYLLLPKDFGVPEEDCIERSIHSMDEVVALSVDVVDFCVAHGLSSKDANRLALCIEEMAGNVIEHGFADGKPHHLDVRVLIKDGETVLRMRDDCVLFNLREQAEHWSFDPEHPERNIGIRMVMHAAKDLAYTNTMKTNNLIIKI